MNNQGQLSCVIVGFVRDKTQAVRKNIVIDTKSLGGRGFFRLFHLWNGSCHSFHGLEMGLAHLVKVSLGLLGAALDLAGLWLGTVPLAEALRLDNAVAALDPAVPTFVFQKHACLGKLSVCFRVCSPVPWLFRGCNGSTNAGRRSEAFGHRNRVRVKLRRRGHGPFPFALERSMIS